MESQKENNGHGGRRQGAGRPKVYCNTKTIALRIPEDVAAILDRQKNRSAYIIEAIRTYERERSNPAISNIEAGLADK